MKIITKFSLIIFFITVTIGGFTIFFTYNSTYSSIEEISEKEQQLLAEKLSVLLDSFVFERYQDVRFFDILKRSKDIFFNKNNIQARDLRNSFKYYLSLSYWESVSLVDLKGNIIISTIEQEEGLNVYDSEEEIVKAFERSLDGEISNSDVFIQKYNNSPAFVFFSPITDAQSLEVIGLVKAVLPWNAIEQLLNDVSGNFVYLFNDRGQLIGSNAKRYLKPLDAQKINNWFDYSNHPVYLKTLQGDEGTFFETSLLGDYKSLISFARQEGNYDYPGNNWVLVIETPLSVFYASARKSALMVSLAAIPIIIFSAFIFFFLLYRLLLKPVNELALISRKIIDGNLTVRAKVRSNDEFGYLARTFNDLTDRLVSLNDSLESSVEQRTKQLQDQNLRLEQTKKAVLNLLEDIQVEKEGISKRQALDEALLSSIGESVIAIDGNNNITFVNNAAESLFKIKSNLVIGKKYYEIFASVDEENNLLKPEERPMYQVIKSGKVITDNSLSVLLKNKIQFPVGIITAPVILSGKVIGAIGVFRDISKEKEIDKMKTEFVSVASHQLRTPLTAIRWYLEELAGGELGPMPSNQKDYIQQVIESNQRMIKLVNDLLNVSRLETGRVNIAPSPTDLTDLIKKTIDNHLPLAKARNCGVMFRQPIAPVPIMNIDSSMIGLVLDNLVSNAIKYSIGKLGACRIVINIDQDNEFVTVNIEDSGIGIPKENQHRIFEKFFRADNAVKLETEGSGLGLYIAKLIIEASGGKIWFISKANQGTKFSFTLPIAGSKAFRGETNLA